jgi:hypothetical protein
MTVRRRPYRKNGVLSHCFGGAPLAVPRVGLYARALSVMVRAVSCGTQPSIKLKLKVNTTIERARSAPQRVSPIRTVIGQQRAQNPASGGFH